MSTETRRGLYGRMAGDTALTQMLGAAAPGYGQNIYYGEAPQPASFPFVIFNKTSGMPIEAFGLASVYEIDTYMVKAVDHALSPDQAEAIRDRVVTLLNDAALSISGRKVLKLRRQSDLEYDEVVEGEMYRHIGAVFRLETAHS